MKELHKEYMIANQYEKESTQEVPLENENEFEIDQKKNKDLYEKIQKSIELQTQAAIEKSEIERKTYENEYRTVRQLREAPKFEKNQRVVEELKEKFIDESDQCFNGGIKGTLTQTHYFYKSDYKNERVRITKRQYSDLKREEDATTQILDFELDYEEVTKPACKCTTGWAGLQC